MHRFHHANLNLGDVDTAPTANLLGVPCVWQRICTCYDGTPEEIVNANLHTRIDLHRCDKEPTTLVATAKEAAIPRGKKPKRFFQKSTLTRLPNWRSAYSSERIRVYCSGSATRSKRNNLRGTVIPPGSTASRYREAM
jgi:hypothetical protein